VRRLFVPFFYTIGLNVVYVLSSGIVFLPIRSTKIPIAKENFFSPKHALSIVNPIMGDKCFETAVVTPQIKKTEYP
jgi:hypothetical protein